MTKTLYFVIFCLVCIVHIVILRSYINTDKVVAKEKAKIHHITLSRVVVKKTPPPVIPPEPIIESVALPNPKPFVKPKKNILKPKKKKRVKKRIKKTKVIKEVKKQKVVSKPSPVKQKQFIAPISKVDTSTIKDRYIKEIRRQIRQKLIYPKIAKRMHIEGEVNIAFVVGKDGDISGIRVVNSSRKILSNGALKTIKSLSLKPIPKALGVSLLKLEVPIEFKLTKG